MGADDDRRRRRQAAKDDEIGRRRAECWAASPPRRSTSWACGHDGEEVTIKELKPVEPLLWTGAEISDVFRRVLLPLQPCRIRDGAIRASSASTSGGQRPDKLPAAPSRSCPTRGRNDGTVVGSTGSGSGRSPH
uniref:Uncharacterized protein n=1 Tax=Oryza nivara TaxID=4536 RepID=A0A0E0J1F3_ORYNI